MISTEGAFVPGGKVFRIGTDICSVNRIRQAHARFGERFLRRILTDTESSYVLSQPAHMAGRLAGRFAAKEAVSKALGTGWHGVGWKEIEIVRQDSGAPSLKLYGRAAGLAKRLGLLHWQVSLSHERDYATAFVLAWEDTN